MGDHLSCETTFAWPQGWSPIAGFTVYIPFATIILRILLTEKGKKKKKFR
jgi:hypothetical protein